MCFSKVNIYLYSIAVKSLKQTEEKELVTYILYFNATAVFNIPREFLCLFEKKQHFVPVVVLSKSEAMKRIRNTKAVTLKTTFGRSGATNESD